MNENTPENDTQQQNERLTPASGSPKRSEVYDWIQCVVVALVFCVLLFSFFVRLVDVIGSSMYPTLENADKMLVSDLFYTPKQGDIIVFQKESFMEEPLVKRIIAVAGQTVDIDFDTGPSMWTGRRSTSRILPNRPIRSWTSTGPSRYPTAAFS
jgi:signal peptidase I